MTSSNEIREQAINESLKFSQSFINKLEGIKYMKNKSQEYDSSDIKKYLVEVCKQSLTKNIEKVVIGLMSIQMVFNIPQYLINKDYDIIKNKIGAYYD